MSKKILVVFLILGLFICLTACTNDTANDMTDNDTLGNDAKGNETEENGVDMSEDEMKPSISGIQLNDTKDTVEEILGTDYEEFTFDEAGHFPEKHYNWEYEKGYTISIGEESGTVLQIVTTSPDAKTNLDIKVGDTADKVLSLYREKYIEPESIHGGGTLKGVFKVEDDQVIIFDFDIEDGLVNPEEIKTDDRVARIILTYPAYLDESF